MFEYNVILYIAKCIRPSVIISLFMEIFMQAKNALFLSVILMLIYCISCANDQTTSSNKTDSTRPVETKAPNSDYKPAFGGQTRIAGVKTTTPYNVEKITERLGPPFAIVSMPRWEVNGNHKIGLHGNS